MTVADHRWREVKESIKTGEKQGRKLGEQRDRRVSPMRTDLRIE